MELKPEEFVERLLTEDEASGPCDDCKSSELQLSLPPWFDETLFRAGQKFYRDNFYGMVGSQVMGLITIIAVPSTLEILVNTRRSSSTWTAYRRYASTLLHVISWHSHELRPGTKSWKSIWEVRRRHLQASKTAQTLGYGLVTQRDVALTQFGFIGHAMLFPDRFGIQAFDRNSWDGYNHFWRTVTYMLGLKDRYNLGAGSVEETTEVCRVLMRRVFAPLLECPPEPYEHMAFVILDSLWSILPLVDPKSTLYMARLMAGVPGYVYSQQDMLAFRANIKNGAIAAAATPAKESWHAPERRPTYDISDFYLLEDVPQYKQLFPLERLKLNTIMFLTQVYATYLGKIILNWVLRCLVCLTEYFPVLAFVRFGYARSFVRMFDESVSDRTKPMSNAEVRKMYGEAPWYVRSNPLTFFRVN